jgi:hypothetical protein
MTPQYILINKNGDKYYFKDKQMTISHREDGPAIEYANGTKANGTKYWCINNKLHREDGPAVEWSDGNKYWYLNDESLTEAEFLKRTAPEIILTMDEIAAKLGVDVSKLKIKK